MIICQLIVHLLVIVQNKKVKNGKARFMCVLIKNVQLVNKQLVYTDIKFHGLDNFQIKENDKTMK